MGIPTWDEVFRHNVIGVTLFPRKHSYQPTGAWNASDHWCHRLHVVRGIKKNKMFLKNSFGLYLSHSRYGDHIPLVSRSQYTYGHGFLTAISRIQRLIDVCWINTCSKS